MVFSSSLLIWVAQWVLLAMLYSRGGIAHPRDLDGPRWFNCYHESVQTHGNRWRMDGGRLIKMDLGPERMSRVKGEQSASTERGTKVSNLFIERVNPLALGNWERKVGYIYIYIGQGDEITVQQTGTARVTVHWKIIQLIFFLQVQ